jgi:tetratricopeptide (TPR) repeat protein
MTEEKKNRILSMISSASEIRDSAEKSRKYRNIVGILSMEAVRSNNLWYLEEAIKTAELVTDDPSKAYVEIIRAMAKIGMNRKDEEMLKEGVKITGRINNNLDLSVALHELVVAFAKNGIDRKDEKLLSYSLDLSEKIPSNTYRSSAFRNIARLLVGANPERALELLGSAIELIEKSKDVEPVFLAFAFCDIASLLSLLNDGRSYVFIKRAIMLADGIADEFEKSAVLLKIVETERAIGTKQKDEELLKEAIVLSERITREYYKTLAADAVKGIA